MILESKVQDAQLRLARHYIKLASDADQMYQYGGENSLHALTVLDAERAQIEKCRMWLSEQANTNDEAARLLVAMTQETKSLLRVRLTSSDLLQWYMQALAIAQRLGDTAAAAEQLQGIADTYYQLRDYEQAETFILQASELAEQYSHWHQLSDALNTRSFILMDSAKFEEAAEIGQRALSLYRDLGDARGMLKLLTKLAWIKIRAGQWDAAEGYARDCYVDALKRGDLEVISNTLNILGTIAHHKGQFTDAIEYRTQALDYDVRLNDQRSWCNTMMQIATCYDIKGDFSAAENAYLQALATARAIGFQRLVGGILINLGYSAYLQSRFADAVHYLEEGLNEVRALKAEYFLCVALANLIPAYLPLEQYTKGLQALQEGLEIAASLEAEPLKVTMLVAAVQTWVALAHREINFDDQHALLSSAAHWSGLILVYPSAEQENRDEINKLLPNMVSGLGSEQVESLLQQGAQHDIDEVLASVLKKLETLA